VNNQKNWTETELQQQARVNAVRGAVVRTDYVDIAHHLMDQALSWQHHLFSAGEYEAADDIVNGVFEVLIRRGERDRARYLLLRSIATLKGSSQDLARQNMVKLIDSETEINKKFPNDTPSTSQYQGAEEFSYLATSYWKQGEFQKAIECEEQSLQIERTRNNLRGQAISEMNLAIYYCSLENYPVALDHNDKAVDLAKRLRDGVGDESVLAHVLYQRGVTLRYSARMIAINDPKKYHLRQEAYETFQQSLNISHHCNDRLCFANNLVEMGKSLMDSGELSGAAEVVNSALLIYQEIQQFAAVGVALEMLGFIHEIQNQFTAALEKYQQALELAHKYSSPQ
jgi:tetratricopeptide (TPR) repeat protein